MDIGVLVWLVPLWPGWAIFFYIRHSRRIERTRRVPVVLYLLGVVICGGVAGVIGVGWGINRLVPVRTPAIYVVWSDF